MLNVTLNEKTRQVLENLSRTTSMSPEEQVSLAVEYYINNTDDVLEEIEDKKIAIQALKEFEKGKSTVYSWEEVKKEIGLGN